MKRVMDFLAPALLFLVPLVWASDRLVHPGPWLGFFAYAAILLSQPHLDPGEMATATGRDRLSALGIYAAVFVPQLVSILQYAFRATWSPPPLGWQVLLGVGLAVSGLAFRIWAIRTLGRFFTAVVMVQEGQKVIQTGPYRLLRHPSYTGAFIVAVAVPIALGSWLGVVLSCLLVIPSYLHRIKAEEAALVADLGDEYRQYMRRTSRLIPYVF